MKRIKMTSGLYIRLLLSMAAMTVLFTVSGVLAWFSDTETVTNIVKTTGLVINVHETGGNYYEVIPGATAKKDPRIANVSPNQDSVYVRVEVELFDFRKVTYTPQIIYSYIEVDGTRYEMIDLYGKEYESGEIVTALPQYTDDGTIAVDRLNEIKLEIANGAPRDSFNYASGIFYVNLEGRTQLYDADAVGDDRWWEEYEDVIYDVILEAVADETINDDGVTPAWYYEDGFWYYNAVLEYDPVGVYFFKELVFDGNIFGNEYQSVYFKLPIYAEAVQAVHFFDSTGLSGNAVGQELARLWPD